MTRKLENRADELQRFKTEVNLAEYAQAQGYELLKAESSAASKVLVRGGDKVIVTTAPDGHGVYFSVRDDQDNGSIIDFVQRRQGLNLGQVRKELRPWIGEGELPPEVAKLERIAKPRPVPKDVGQVMAQWARMDAGDATGYLAGRGISAQVLADPRFAPVIRTGQQGQVCFPHYNAGGLCGFEQKNPDRFSAGGEKAAWITTNIKHASMVVVTESPVDAMSLDQLLQEDGADTRHIAYVSTGGTMSHKQADTLRQVLERAQERGAAVKLATDGDPAGDRLAEQLQALAPQPAERIRPPEGQDWNDHLQARQHEQAQQAAQEQQQARPRHRGMSM